MIRLVAGGVDLNRSSALIPLKLLILQYAKLAQEAKTANLSYTFFTLYVEAAIFVFAHATAAQHRAFLTLQTMSIISGLEP